MRCLPHFFGVVAVVWPSLLSSCDSPGDSKPAATARPNTASSEEAEGVSAPARWIRVRAPGDATLLTAPARVAARAEARGDVSTPYPARVVNVRAMAGQKVEKGDPILEVVMPVLVEAAGNYVATQAQLDVHVARAAELSKLQRDQLVERSQVFEQEVRVAELRAESARALAVLRSAGVSAKTAHEVFERGVLVLRSPVAGVVREISARPGEVRQPGAPPLATIFGEAEARIEARLSQGLPSEAKLRFDAADGRRIGLESKPESTVVDPVDGTHVLFLRPKEKIELPEGLRGTLIVSIDRQGVFEVPARAVRAGDEGPEVMRRGPEGKPEPVRVRVLASAGATALVEGLTESDVVAANAKAWSPARDEAGH